MIRMSKSCISNKEIHAVNEVLKKEFLGMGEETLLFEIELEAFVGREAVCVSSGTAALQLALEALDVGYGDEVLVQSLTYVASFQAISATGAIPIPVEVDEDVAFCVKDAATKVNERTKAIMPMHYAGRPSNWLEIMRFAKNNGLRVVEDAAHAFGSKFEGALVGSMGDVSCFSFDGIKNITAGEGGAVFSNDHKVIERIRDSRLLGVKRDSEARYQNQRSVNYDVQSQGWRYHMSNINAAIGRVQLSRFEELSTKRQLLAKKYVSLLEGMEGLELFDTNFDEVVPHIFPVKLKGDKNRQDVISYLSSREIQAGFHYLPNHKLSFYQSERKLPKTDVLFPRLLTLPMHPDLDLVDVENVCTRLMEAL